MFVRKLEKLPLHPCLVLIRAVSPEGELLNALWPLSPRLPKAAVKERF